MRQNNLRGTAPDPRRINVHQVTPTKEVRHQVRREVRRLGLSKCSDSVVPLSMWKTAELRGPGHPPGDAIPRRTARIKCELSSHGGYFPVHSGLHARALEIVLRRRLLLLLAILLRMSTPSNLKRSGGLGCSPFDPQDSIHTRGVLVLFPPTTKILVWLGRLGS